MKTQKTWNEDDIPYVATGFAKQLDKSKKIVTNSDQDRVFVYDGREGVGKSTVAMQHAFYLDNKLTLDNVVFTSKDFKSRIRSLSRHRALIWDESFKGLSSKGALSKENRKIVTLLQECRQRNLYIFIVLPTIFLLETYAAIFRSHALIHAGSYKHNFKLRYYKVYNYTNKKLLYLLGKKLYNYSKPKITRSYRFYSKLPPTIDPKEYRDKKEEAFKDVDRTEPEETKAIKQRNYLMYILNKEYKLKYGEIAEKLSKKGIGIDKSTIGKHIRGTGT